MPFFLSPFKSIQVLQLSIRENDVFLTPLTDHLEFLFLRSPEEQRVSQALWRCHSDHSRE